jgi:dihydroorotase
MTVLIKKVRVIDCSKALDIIEDVLISPDEITLSPHNVKKARVVDGQGKILAPGLVDLHVHFREPGFTYKEDIQSGINAALAGGVTSALVMPNTSPAIDQAKHVYYQRKRAEKTGFNLMVAAAASIGLEGQKATDIASLKQAGAKAVTDDGKPILNDSLMEEIFKRCRRHDLVCMQHAEDLRQSHGYSLNLGKASKKTGLCGQPGAAETRLIERDIALSEKIGARYHVLHLSCKESLKVIRDAKRRGAFVTCEVTPHHLLLDDSYVFNLDTNKKMNPPLRSKEDVEALVEGLNDRTIDAVASDHAPHAAAEKRKSFERAPFGVVGLESAILVLFTLVKKGKLSIKRAIELMTSGPASIIGESESIGTFCEVHAAKNAVLLNPHFLSTLSGRKLFGRSKNSAFIGHELYGKVEATFLNGKIAFCSVDWS